MDESPPMGSRPPMDPAPRPSTSRRGLWPAVGAALALGAFKLKALLGPLVVGLKSLKIGKLAVTGLSMLAMIWVEAQRYGWAYGVGFVVLILVHELGHGFAIKRAGLDAGWPVFIPFVGAMISLRGRPQDPGVEAEIAYAGPLAGTGAALASAGLYFLTGSRLFLALAATGFFLNLFNLTPLSPLDGGRVAQAFSRRAWIVGLLVLGGLFFFTGGNPVLLIVGIVGVGRALAGGSTFEGTISDEERRAWSYRYFGLCFFLGLGFMFAERLLHPAA